MFSNKPNPRDQSRATRREIRSTQRDIAKERTNLERMEKQLIGEIKQSAQKNPSHARNLTKQLIRVRNQLSKTDRLSSHVTSVGISNSTMQSSIKTMAGVTNVMRTVNKQHGGVEGVMKNVRDFQNERDSWETKEDMLEDTLDALSDSASEDEGESQQILDQIYDEIGLDLTTRSHVPRSSLPATSVAASSIGTREASTSDPHNLEKRLAGLRVL
ncbi:Snf7-domain-containing protein [Gaertneriomyces semiglobifer]|nr:Snf7-domain-containing protein [Gaertneriomyces semiglobifer]